MKNGIIRDLSLWKEMYISLMLGMFNVFLHLLLRLSKAQNRKLNIQVTANLQFTQETYDKFEQILQVVRKIVSFSNKPLTKGAIVK